MNLHKTYDQRTVRWGYLGR